jgi:hypothetical protein
MYPTPWPTWQAISVVLTRTLLIRPLPSTFPSIPRFGAFFDLSVFQLSSLYALLIELRNIYLTKMATMATSCRKIVSSARLPNARRPDVVPSEQQLRSLEKVQRYLDAPVEEDGLVNDDTKAHRQWLMGIWNK